MEGLTEQNKRVMQEVLATQMLEPIKTEPRDSTSPYGGTSPFGGGVMYQAASPNYVPTPAISPQFYELAPTPSPESLNYPYRLQTVNVGNFNVMQQIKPDPNWNMQQGNPQEPMAGPSWNIPSNPAEQPPQLLDLDNHQINSGDLQNHLNEMNIPNMGHLPEFNNLSLTEIDMNPQSQNMSDSLTNILNEAAVKNLGG